MKRYFIQTKKGCYKRMSSSIRYISSLIYESSWILILGHGIATGCSNPRSFWRYIIEEDVAIPTRPKGEVDMPRVMSPHNVKVVYSDGSTSTEVLIPILSSGQHIVIDHKKMKTPRSLSLTPLPPVDADKAVEEAYVKNGLPVASQKPPVSIIKTHEKIRELVKEGQDHLALEYVEQVLDRYPSHVKTLRTKGSLLLKIGERDAALKAYRKAQDIEPDLRVEEQIKQIETKLTEPQ